jgi:hypothetical protein
VAEGGADKLQSSDGDDESLDSCMETGMMMIAEMFMAFTMASTDLINTRRTTNRSQREMMSLIATMLDALQDNVGRMIAVHLDCDMALRFKTAIAVCSE